MPRNYTVVYACVAAASLAVAAFQPGVAAEAVGVPLDVAGQLLAPATRPGGSDAAGSGAASLVPAAGQPELAPPSQRKT